MASFKGQLKLEPRPDWAPLDRVRGGGGVKKQFSNELHPTISYGSLQWETREANLATRSGFV